MKTAIDRALGQNPFQASAARQREKERDASDELWALAVTHTLVAYLPRLSLAEASLASQATAPLSDHGAEGAAAEDAPDGRIDDSEGEGAGKSSSSDAHGVPAELRAELSDERLGRLGLHVSRTEGGLDIVINVADSRVKALIETDRAMLLKTLKDAGLRVASVQIGSPSRAGTALAVDRGGAEKAHLSSSHQKPGARRRTYPGSPEEADADSEGLDFTA
jgi:hypothetical protein